jgi:hypothetical protein
MLTPFDDTPNRLEAVFFQRDSANQYYEQINISGSDLIVYLDSDGRITADKVGVFASKYGLTGGGTGSGTSASSSWASHSLTSVSASYVISASYAVTASYVQNVPSSSYALTASYSLNGSAAASISSSWASSSLFSISSSWASQSLFADTSSYSTASLTSSYTYFNGARSIKRTGYSGLNVGGDDVAEFLENFFFPFVSASIALNSGTVTFETGTVQSVAINNTITANDETVWGTESIRRDNVEWSIYTGSIPPYTYNVTETNVSSSHTYQTYVQVGNNGSPTLKTTSTRTISFGYPFLWGISSTPNLTGSALYLATVSHSGFSQANIGPTPIWGTGTYIYFAYPSTYADLISILDPNNFEALPNFEYTASVPVTSSGLTYNWMRTYKVYRLHNLASPNGNFTFKFT